jgi:hypothetical protein
MNMAFGASPIKCSLLPLRHIFNEVLSDPKRLCPKLPNNMNEFYALKKSRL